MSTTNTSSVTSNNLGSGAAPANSSAGAGTADALNGVKGAFAAVHGAGEKIRGEFNAGVDRAFNDPTGAVKNAGIANQGDAEMQTGHFSTATKNREGTIPGDNERRVL